MGFAKEDEKQEDGQNILLSWIPSQSLGAKNRNSMENSEGILEAILRRRKKTNTMKNRPKMIFQMLEVTLGLVSISVTALLAINSDWEDGNVKILGWGNFSSTL